MKETSQLAEAYAVLGGMLPLIAQQQAENKVLGVLLDGDRAATTSFAGYKVTLRSSRTPFQLDAGQAPLEPSKAGAEKAQDDSPFGPPPPETRPYGLILSTGPDEFLIVGSGLLVNFEPASAGPKIAEIGSIDEGRFEKGQWITGRRLNGDEGRIALPSGRIGTLKVKLYRRD